MKIGLVVQRLGDDLSGGSELLCLEVAQQLAGAHEVEILASNAGSYRTWEPKYPAGPAEVGGIPVRRFEVERERDPGYWQPPPPPGRLAADWVRRFEGPDAPTLRDHLARHGDQYDRVMFFTFRYWTTHACLPLVADRGLLCPTAEDEPAIGYPLFHEAFALARGIAFLTPEERRLVYDRVPGANPRHVVAGMGLRCPEPDPDRVAAFRARHGLQGDYLVYVGRVDPWKGCGELLSHLARYAEEVGPPPTLVLAGDAYMELPEVDWLRPLGFVSAEDKLCALAGAAVKLMPSAHESFSIASLEAMGAGTPVLANARCRVLVGHCRRSQGGLWYDGYQEFREALTLMLEPATRRRLGENARRYVLAEYDWDRVAARYLAFVEEPV
ncbi:MAG: glycosyltransferase family 4 protein [Candidatus Dormibacteria bacterium]